MVKLTPYQKHAVNELEQKAGRAILALPAGLGKTFTTLAFLKKQKVTHFTVLCPKSKIPEWEKDIELFFPNYPIYILSGNMIYYQTPGINLGTFKSITKLDGFPTEALILDESTFVKEITTQTFQNIFNYVTTHKPKFIIELSGTPALNHPYELYTQIKLLEYDNPTFISYEEFLNQFCYTYWDGRYNQLRIKGLKNNEKLKNFLNRYLIKINKQEAEKFINLPELKTKIFTIRNWFFNDNRRQIGLKKIKFCTKLVKDIIKHYPDEQIVIFIEHKDVLKALQQNLEGFKIDYITGERTKRGRHQILKAFQEKKIQILICNIKAAGMGINLQTARIAIILEFPWTPELVEQCIKRIHRRGQTRKCYVYYIKLANSLDEKIIQVWIKKKQILNQIGL